MWCSFTYGSSGTVFVSSAAAFVQQSITVMEIVSTNAHHTASISWVLQLKLIQLEMGLHWWVLQFTWQGPLSKEQRLLLNKLPSPSSKFNCCCTTSCALCLPIAGCHKGLNLVYVGSYCSYYPIKLCQLMTDAIVKVANPFCSKPPTGCTSMITSQVQFTFIPRFLCSHRRLGSLAHCIVQSMSCLTNRNLEPRICS